MINPRQDAFLKTTPVSLSETARRQGKSVDPCHGDDVQPRRARGTRQASGDLEGTSYAHHMDRPSGARRRRPVVLLRPREGAGQEDELARRRRRSQRTSWQRNETLLSKTTVKGMKLLWTVQTDNQPRQMHNLFAPLIIGDVSTPSGPRDLAIVAGISDNIYGIDVEKGTQVWNRHFDSTFQESPGGRGYGPLCPGGLTATPVVAPLDTPGQVQGLCDLVGRAAASARCSRGIAI